MVIFRVLPSNCTSGKDACHLVSLKLTFHFWYITILDQNYCSKRISHEIVRVFWFKRAGRLAHTTVKTAEHATTMGSASVQQDISVTTVTYVSTPVDRSNSFCGNAHRWISGTSRSKPCTLTQKQFTCSFSDMFPELSKRWFLCLTTRLSV